MITYIVMVRILGGEWQRHRVGGKDFETNDLALALGQKETVADPIREVMVVAISHAWKAYEGGLVITGQYELVE